MSKKPMGRVPWVLRQCNINNPKSPNHNIEAATVNEWIVPTAGGILVLAGLSLVQAHVRSWKRQKTDPELDDADYSHLSARYRRRLQTSSMIAMLGVLLAVGDQLPILRKRPGLFGLYWFAVLLLTLWVVVLAAGDFDATQANGRTSLAEFRKKQRDLERQAAEIKRRRSNGQDTPG